MQREQLGERSMTAMPISVLDGGLGTTLRDQYQASVDGPKRPLWSSHLLISDPATLQAVHTSFADAGADIILTATYQASLEGFARTRNPKDGNEGIPPADAEKYMRSAVKLARASSRKDKDGHIVGKVALSLGAYGATMIPSQEYTGNYDESHNSVKQLRDWHKKRLEIFTGADEVWRDIDMVAFETLPLLKEVEAVRETMAISRKVPPDRANNRPFWISCVFPGEDLCLPDSSSVDSVVRAMLEKREGAAVPFAIGINCTKVGKIPELLREFETSIKRMIDAQELMQAPSLVLYPDGTMGEVYNTMTYEWEIHDGNRDSVPWDQMMLDIVQNTRERGLWGSIIVGGCCKARPEDIKKLKQRLDTIHT